MLSLSISLHFSTPVFFVLVACAIAFAGTSLIYHKAGFELSSRVKKILSSLRFISILLICLLILDPFIRTKLFSNDKPVVAILIDDSASMLQHRDSLFMLQAFPGKLKKLKDRFPDVRFQTYRFSGEIKAVYDDTSGFFRGNSTNISDALEKTSRIFRREYFSGIILASDGLYNEGIHPLHILDRLQVPVYGLVAGDTAKNKDIRVINVISNDVNFLHDEIPVRAYIDSHGYSGKKTSVLLKKGNLVIREEFVILETDHSEMTVDFTLPALYEGVEFYEIIVTPLPGEFSVKNNQMRFPVRIEKSRSKILLLAGNMTPDVAAIRRALESNPNYSVTLFARKNQSEYYHSPKTIPFDSFSVFIFINFPSSSKDAALISVLRDAFGKQGKGVFCFMGKGTDFQVLRTLNDYLPVRLKLSRLSQSETFFSLEPSYRMHSTYTFPQGRLEEWLSGAPPLLVSDSEFEVKPGAQSFSKKTVKGITISQPLFVLGDMGEGGRSAVFFGDGYWRLRMNDYYVNGNSNLFDSWLLNIVRWLSINEFNKRFSVIPSRYVYSHSEDVKFHGELYDESFNRIRGAEINLFLKDSSGNEVRYVLQESANGLYGQNVGKLKTGNYLYSAKGMYDGKLIGTSEGKISVSAFSPEYLSSASDYQLMNQISLRTGGRAYPAADADSLTEFLRGQESLKPKENIRMEYFPLSQWEYPFFLLVFLIVFEWALRKRYGVI